MSLAKKNEGCPREMPVNVTNSVLLECVTCSY